eukprot:GSA120T00026321001.1
MLYPAETAVKLSAVALLSKQENPVPKNLLIRRDQIHTLLTRCDNCPLDFTQNMHVYRALINRGFAWCPAF